MYVGVGVGVILNRQVDRWWIDARRSRGVLGWGVPKGQPSLSTV